MHNNVLLNNRLSLQPTFTMKSDMRFSENLINSIKNGESTEVKKILRKQPHLCRTIDASGSTLLHYCTKYNNANVAQYLLKKCCDIDAQNSIGNTSLMISVMENHEKMMELLLSSGANILKLNKKKQNVFNMINSKSEMKFQNINLFILKLQKKYSSSKIANTLLKAKFTLYNTSLLKKPSSILETMLNRYSRYYDVNSAHPISKMTAMHVNASFDNLEGIRVLLKYGADVNALNAKNENPLHQVYKFNRKHSAKKIEILKTLLNQGASMTSCTMDGVFQAFFIFTRCNGTVLRTLIESGLDFTVKDNRSHLTALHYLAINKDPTVIEELKLHVDKFDVNICDGYGQTPIFNAIVTGNPNMVKFLLENNAKIDSKHGIFGTTPLYYAYKLTTPELELEYEECGEILLQNKADPQLVAIRRNGDKVTIFDAALEKNNLKRIRPVVAHLAMLEKLGTPITEIIRDKINSNRLLEKYFSRCQKSLNEKIYGKVALCNLLTSDKRKMARYMNNKNIIRKINAKKFKRKMMYHRYYNKILRRIQLEGKCYKKLKDGAAEVICQIFRNRIDKTNLIVREITDYLDDESLKKLCLANHETKNRQFL